MRWKNSMTAVGVLALLAATPAVRGGWVIVTMHEWPQALEAGRPTTLTFSMRQHGQELLSGRQPVVHVKGPGLLGSRERVRAERTDRPGVYRATITPADRGALRVSVDTDFNGWTAPMLPLEVRDRGVTLASNSQGHARGQALFVAKGCAGCHAKTDDDALDEIRVVQVGPDLTGRTYPAGWVERKILDPASQRTSGLTGDAVMPVLEVTEAEARLIAGYINARSVAARD
jgi:mono/diheme cytochrome c family protein